MQDRSCGSSRRSSVFWLDWDGQSVFFLIHDCLPSFQLSTLMFWRTCFSKNHVHLNDDVSGVVGLKPCQWYFMLEFVAVELPEK